MAQRALGQGSVVMLGSRAGECITSMKVFVRMEVHRRTRVCVCSYLKSTNKAALYLTYLLPVLIKELCVLSATAVVCLCA